MKTILLLGGGGHCRSVIDVIESTQRYRIAGIVQPPRDGDAPVLGYPILGDDEDLPELIETTPCALVTVGQLGNSALRQRLFARLRQLEAELPCVVSAYAHVSRHAALGDGSVVLHGAIVNAAATIGNNVIVNSMALVEHDVSIGEHCHIATGARVNGGVCIASGCFVGSGAIIHQGVHIGSDCVIGAGCVIKKDVPAGSVIMHG